MGLLKEVPKMWVFALIFAGVMIYNFYVFAKAARRLQEEHNHMTKVLEMISARLEKRKESGE